MVAIGLILLLIGLVGGGWLGWLAVQSDTGVTLSMTGLQITILPITLFAAGAVSMLLLWLGVRLMGLGAYRRGARRREMRDLRSAPAATPAVVPQATPAVVPQTTDRGQAS